MCPQQKLSPVRGAIAHPFPVFFINRLEEIGLPSPAHRLIFVSIHLGGLHHTLRIPQMLKACFVCVFGSNPEHTLLFGQRSTVERDSRIQQGQHFHCCGDARLISPRTKLADIQSPAFGKRGVQRDKRTVPYHVPVIPQFCVKISAGR
jgi:hypothetical protein